MKSRKSGRSRRPIRVFLAKGGLDGHDRGILVIAAALRDAGFEIIYGGLYQSPKEIVSQVYQEDPDIVGVSVLSGGHRYVFEELVKILGARIKEYILVGGGIIPPHDREWMIGLGVRAVFEPGTSIEKEMVPVLLRLCESHTKQTPRVETLYKGVKRGSPTALGRFISLLAADDPDAHACIASHAKEFPFSRIVGFSGSGGVGKSSLVAKLVSLLRKSYRIGVVCVDPLSTSGGAFLADRIRMPQDALLEAPHVFIRSLAAHDPFLGVTKQTPPILDAMQAAGKEFIFVETMGRGQEDEGFKNMVDTFVYLVTPDMGDEMQMLKGGVIETADIIVVNKSDREGASQVASLLKEHFGKREKSGWHIPIVQTNTFTREGVPELWEAIQRHGEFLKQKPQ